MYVRMYLRVNSYLRKKRSRTKKKIKKKMKKIKRKPYLSSTEHESTLMILSLCLFLSLS